MREFSISRTKSWPSRGHPLLVAETSDGAHMNSRLHPARRTFGVRAGTHSGAHHRPCAPHLADATLRAEVHGSDIPTTTCACHLQHHLLRVPGDRDERRP